MARTDKELIEATEKNSTETTTEKAILTEAVTKKEISTKATTKIYQLTEPITMLS